MIGFPKKWHRPDREWPKYLPGGRLRTSTAALVIVFALLTWLYETYQPPVASTPETQVVPPGFVPDPEYTWVPRTNVRTRPPTTTPLTTTPTTTESTPTTAPENPDTTGPPDASTPPTAPNPFQDAPSTTPTSPTTTVAPGPTPTTTSE